MITGESFIIGLCIACLIVTTLCAFSIMLNVRDIKKTIETSLSNAKITLTN